MNGTVIVILFIGVPLAVLFGALWWSNRCWNKALMDYRKERQLLAKQRTTNGVPWQYHQ